MGNVLRKVVKRERKGIKIMKVDRAVEKLQSPAAYVKEMNCNLSRPLPQSAELRAGDLYFVIPLPSPFSSISSGHNNITGTENAGHYRPQISPTVCSGMGSTKEEIDDKAKLRIISASDKGSPVRIRIRLRKEEAASLLSLDGNKLMQKLVAPLIPQITMEKIESHKPSAWKPSLETITEQLNPALHHCNSKHS